MRRLQEKHFSSWGEEYKGSSPVGQNSQWLCIEKNINWTEMQNLTFKKCACVFVHGETEATLTYLDGLYIKVPLLQRHSISEGSFQPDIQN